MNKVDELAKIIETGLAEGGALYDIDFVALKNARTALAELVSLARPEAIPIPNGWKLVPLEPTKEMCVAGEAAVDKNIDSTTDSYQTYDVYDQMTLATAAYEAMLAAAPTYG